MSISDKQRRRGDVLIKGTCIAYGVVALLASPHLGWYVALVALGIGMFIAGFTACAHTPERDRHVDQ